jgi:tetratricopeptide (TPR) repeat protein
MIPHESGTAFFHLESAQRLLAVERYDLAEAEARKALAADPGLAAGHRTLAVALLEQSRVGEARQEVDEALRLAPTDTGTLRVLANVQYRQGKLDEGVVTLRMVLSLEPRSADTYRMLAEALLLQRRPTEALAAAHAGLAIDPSDVYLYSALTFILTKLGRFQEAQTAALRGLRIAPDDAALQNNYGLAVSLGGDPLSARDRYAEAARLDPQMASAIGNIQKMQQLSDRVDDAEFRRRATLGTRLQAATWWWARRAVLTRLAIIAATLGAGLIWPMAWILLAACLHMELVTVAAARMVGPWHRPWRQTLGAAFVGSWTLAAAWVIAGAAILWVHNTDGIFGLVAGLALSIPIAYTVAAEGSVRVAGACLATAMLAVAILGQALPAGRFTPPVQLLLIFPLLVFVARRFDRLTAAITRTRATWAPDRR